MSEVVTFGEIMLRLSPEGLLRFLQADRYAAACVGSEANVAVGLAVLGDEAGFVSKVPAHEIGQCAVNALRHYGVHTEGMFRGGPRLGVFYCEKGASQRGGKVIYDRAGSSFALSRRGEYDWERILEGARWFHFSGITPALSDEMPEICADALRVCGRRGITVSCDLNYRGKLWTRERAGEVMRGLLPSVDVLICNEEDAAAVLQDEAAAGPAGSDGIDAERTAETGRRLSERFGCGTVAFTFRRTVHAGENDWAGMLWADGRHWLSKNYRIRLVDRVGGGDSFDAGLIHALLRGMDEQAAIEFAVAVSCLKQTVEYDFSLISEEEALALANGRAGGRIQR